MISFRFIVLVFFLLLLGFKLKSRNRFFSFTSYLDAAIFFWIVLLLFFLNAIVSKKFMVPGDILYNFYPWKALANGQTPHNPLLSDITGCVYPWMVSIKNSLLRFELPLWNRYSYCGSPLAGNQVSAAFHPFNIFFYFMSVPNAATLFPFLRLFIAAMGSFALLRSWKLSMGAAILGSTIFCFCGVHISWLSNYPEVSVTMLIPWIFLSIDKVAGSGSIKWLIPLILLSVLQFLGGHCETSFHLYAWAIPFFFFRVGRELLLHRIDVKTTLLRLGMLIIAGIFSLGLSGFQLLPFLEYLPLSTRMQAISAHNANLFLGLNFLKVFTTVTATLISPDFFGSPIAGNYWGPFNYIEQNAYITITGLLLALMAFIKNKRTSDTGFIKYFFIWGGLFAYLIVIRTPGLFDFIVSLPLFKQDSNHRLIIIFSFAFSILAAFSVNDIQTFGITSKKWLIIFTAGLLIISFFLFRFDGASLTSDQLRYRWIHLCYFFIFLFIIFSILYFSGDHSWIRPYIPALATFMVLVEVFAWGWNFNTFVTRQNIFPSTPLIKFIQSRPGAFRVAAPPGTLPAGTEQVFGFDSITGLDPMKTCSYERIFSRITGKYDSIYSWNPQSFKSSWINFLNVRYIVAPPETTKEELNNKNLIVGYQGKDGIVFKNPMAFARVFHASKILSADSHDKALRLVEKNENMLNRIAIIENNCNFPKSLSGKLFQMLLDKFSGNQYGKLLRNPSGKLSGNLHGTLSKILSDKQPRIISDKNNDVHACRPKILIEKNNYTRICFKGCAGGMYVMSEQYYPGWKLRIDGKPARILRTDYAFMGFSVPDNTKIVEFYYDPMSFKLGLLISLVSVLCLMMFIYFNKSSIFVHE